MNGALQRALAGESQASPEAGAKGHAPKEPRRRIAAAICVVYTNCGSCDYTHAEGARVVLTLPVTRKAAKGRGGSGQSPGDL